MDKERVAVIISSIEQNLSDVEERFKDEETYEDRVKFDAGCMSIFQSINRSIDLAEELISLFRLQIPGSYNDSFDILKKAKIINEGTCEEMKKLVRYRNLISHEYYNIRPEDVKKLLRRIHAIDDFLNEAKKAIL